MNLIFFAQIAAPPTAAIASMALLVKKLFFRGPAEFVTHTDLHREMTSLRDKIDARFFVLGEKLDALKADLLTVAERRSDSIHHRLNQLEANLAPVDERNAAQPLNAMGPDAFPQ